MDQAGTIGDRIREARKRRGFTQDDLARAAGVSKSLARAIPAAASAQRAWLSSRC